MCIPHKARRRSTQCNCMRVWECHFLSHGSQSWTPSDIIAAHDQGLASPCEEAVGEQGSTCLLGGCH